MSLNKATRQRSELSDHPSYCGKNFSITLHVPIAHKCNMAMVAVFIISVTPTTKAIQRQNLGFIRKTEEAHDPKTYQICELKNGNFYTIFVVKFVLFVCLSFVF